MNGEYRGWITMLDTYDYSLPERPAGQGCLAEVRWERPDLLRSYFFTTSPRLQSTLEMAFASRSAIRVSVHSGEGTGDLGAPPHEELVKLTGNLPPSLVSGPFTLKAVWISTDEQTA